MYELLLAAFIFSPTLSPNGSQFSETTNSLSPISAALTRDASIPQRGNDTFFLVTRVIWTMIYEKVLDMSKVC